MASINWAAVSSVVDNQAIKRLGAEATIKRITSRGTFNQNTGTFDGETAMTWPVNAVFTGRREFRQRGELIRVWNLSAVISPGLMEPQTGDQITASGRKYSIGQVNTIRPDGATIVAHEIELID